MPEAPYRDQLEAAHRRIASLEQELADLRHQHQGVPASAVPELLRRHLAPDERVFWCGRSRQWPAVLGQGRGLLWSLGLWAIVAAGVFIAMVRGAPRPLVGFAAAGLGGGALALLLKARQRWRQAKGGLHAVTNRRLLSVRPTSSGMLVDSRDIGCCQGARLLLQRGNVGDLIVPTSGAQDLVFSAIRDPQQAEQALQRARQLPSGQNED